MYQKYIIVGRLTRDSACTFLPSGTEIYKNCIATSKKFKKRDGSQEEKSFFMDFSLFGKAAQTFAMYTQKGSLVLVEGELQNEKWVGQDGQNKSKTTLIVESFKFLGGKNSDNAGKSVSPGAAGESNYYGANMPQQEPAMQQTVPEVDVDDDEIPF